MADATPTYAPSPAIEAPGPPIANDSVTSAVDGQRIGVRSRLPATVRWLTWPMLFIANLTIICVAITQHWNLSAALASTTVAFALILIALEFIYPLDARWKMTLRSFFGRDIKYFAAGGATGAFTNIALGAIGISLNAGHAGPVTTWPAWIAAPLLIFAFDFLQYWQHRWSHEADNSAKHYLWRTHAPHHLPEQVYVLMHPAGHPFNFFLIQGVLRVPLFYALGATPEAVYAASAIIGLQGLVSHCNVDLRAGVFNYVFAGTELHRYHHSGDPTEAKNFAVALSLIDVLFGTFVYRPGSVPKRLGVARPNDYPQSREFWKAMAIPLRRRGYGGPAGARD